jgi:hypothetical protein
MKSCQLRALEGELARQDLELEDAIVQVEHACRRRGRVPAALPALEAALFGRRASAPVSPALGIGFHMGRV